MVLVGGTAPSAKQVPMLVAESVLCPRSSSSPLSTGLQLEPA